MRQAFQERINDILSHAKDVVSHKQKLKIVFDCFKTYNLFLQVMQLEPSDQNTDFIRCDSAIAQIQAIIMMTTESTWETQILSTPIPLTKEVITVNMSILFNHMDGVVKGTSVLFDVPQSRWAAAEIVDFIEIRKLITQKNSKKFSPSFMAQINDEISNTGLAMPLSYPILTSLGTRAFPHSDFKMEKKIGQGSFSLLFSGRFQDRPAAIKFFTGAHLKAEPFSQFACEVAALSHFVHPNIVTFLGFTKEPPFLMATELMDGGSLFSVIRSMSTRPTSPILLNKIALDIAQGLSYIHSQDCIHGDVKSLNVLISKTSEAKLCDFGSSKHLSDHLIPSGAMGTLAWSAPEVLARDQKAITTKIDVFSYGVVLLEMIKKEPPDINDRSIPESTPSPLKELIEKCLSENPSDRPEMKDIVSMFENRTVFFDNFPKEVKVSSQTLAYLLKEKTPESINLIADIAAKVPPCGPLLVPKILEIPSPTAQLSSAKLRALRAICKNAQTSKLIIENGGIKFALDNLDAQITQVKSLLLLLNVVKYNHYVFNQEEIKSLLEYPNSDLVSLVLMFGAPFDEEYFNIFIPRLTGGIDALKFSLVIGFRAYLFRRKNIPLSKEGLISVCNALFDLLRSSAEDCATPALQLLATELSRNNSELHFDTEKMVILSKWVYMGTDVTHISAIQVLLLLFSKPGLFVDTGDNFEYAIVLIRALPESNGQVILSDILLKLLEDPKAAKWFIETQLIRSLELSVAFKFHFIIFKMLLIASRSTEIPHTEAVFRIIREIMTTTDGLSIRIACRFLIINNAVYDFARWADNHFITDLFMRCSDIDAQKDILKLMIEGMKANIIWESGVFVARNALKIPELQIEGVHVIFEEWKKTHNSSLLTADLQKTLEANQEKSICAEFLNSIRISNNELN